MSFDQWTAVSELGENLYQVEVPDTWQQGRGAFGGLVIGMLAKALREAEPDDNRALRSISVDLCGPTLVGPAEIRTQMMRSGSKLSCVDAQLWQGDAVQARASAVFAASRGIETPHHVVAPEVTQDWRDREPAPVQPPLAPTFSQHMEFWPTRNLPFCNADEPVTEGWVRFKEPGARMTAATVLGLLDAHWPVVLVTTNMPRPIATVAFTAQIFCDVSELDPMEPLYYRAQAVTGFEGYYLETRELWSGDQPVAMNQQTIAIIK